MITVAGDIWWIEVEPGTVRHPATVSVSVCLRGCFLFQAGNPANEVKPVVCYLNEVFEYPNMHCFFCISQKAREIWMENNLCCMH
jgi:hypothetical protein